MLFQGQQGAVIITHSNTFPCCFGRSLPPALCEKGMKGQGHPISIRCYCQTSPKSQKLKSVWGNLEPSLESF